MSKRTSRVLGLAAVVAVGLALGVAGAALAEPAPIAPDVQLDEPTPPVLSQECQDWLEWLVDGHAPLVINPYMRWGVGAADVRGLAESCLGREPDWMGERPPSPLSSPPPNSEPEPPEGPDPAADRIDI